MQRVADLEAQAVIIRADLAKWQTDLEEKTRVLAVREEKVRIAEGKQVLNANLLQI